MIQNLGCAALLAATLSFASHAQENSSDDEPAVTVDEKTVTELLAVQEPVYSEEAQAFLDGLTRQTGIVELPGGRATLTVPETYYYLSPDDAERVIVEAWGNPPGQTSLGMLFPAEYTPLDPEGWGVNILFDAIGYVRDDDAADLDYDDLLRDMQRATSDANDERVEQGYEPIELLGWAGQPHYDAVNRQVYWGKRLQFGDAELVTLNYEVQSLGRRGALVMNFIAVESQLDQVLAAIPDVLAMPRYNEGHRYADFDPDVDEVAAYGIGGLIAGGLAYKAGLFSILFAILKKGWILIIVAIGAAWRFFTSRGSKEV